MPGRAQLSGGREHAVQGQPGAAGGGRRARADPGAEGVRPGRK